MIRSRSSTSTARGSALSLIPTLVVFIGFGLLTYGFDHQIRHDETGYVCGNNAPTASEFRDAIPFLRLHDSHATGPFCPLAGAPGVYCYERLERYPETRAYLWWSCDDEDGGEASDEDATATTASCSAGTWRVFRSWDNTLANQYGWYRKSAPDATLGAIKTHGDWKFYNESIELWVNAPWFSISSCSSMAASNVTNRSENFTIPAECYDEQVYYEDSIFIMIGFIMFISPFLCWALALLVVIVDTILCFSPIQSLIGLGCLLTLADIGWYCAEMYILLMFSTVFVALAAVAIKAVVAIIREVWVNKRRIVLEAEVHGKRRTDAGTYKNGRRKYCYWLLVTYEVPLQGQWTVYRTVPTSEPKRVRKWLRVGQVTYDSIYRYNRSIDVLVFPGRPEDAVSAGDASTAFKNNLAFLLILPALVGFSFPGVGLARKTFFSDAYCQKCGDDCCDSCTLWHVKTAYVAAAILLPALEVVSGKANESTDVVIADDNFTQVV